MYMIMRAVQILALVVFLWGRWAFPGLGKFCGDDHRVLSVKKRISEKS